jgi:hypothetical protein
MLVIQGAVAYDAPHCLGVVVLRHDEESEMASHPISASNADWSRSDFHWTERPARLLRIATKGLR